MTPPRASAPTPFEPPHAGTTFEEPTAVSAPLPASGTVTPAADCIADSAGGLTFDLDAPGAPDASGDWSAALVLRLRGGGEADEVRLPLAPGGEGRLRAVLPSTVALPEGRWDVHVACGDAAPRRLRPGVDDLRALVDRRPGPGTSPLSVRIPYTTKHGNLSLRSWLRAPHAEAGDLRPEAAGLTVRGRLYRAPDAAAWLAGAVAEARCRRDADLVVTADLGPGEGQEFSFTLDWAKLTEHWRGGLDVWDLWLRPADGSGPARLARILDDVVDKQQVFAYPVLPVDAGYAPARATAAYDADNDLVVRIDERPPAAS
ncbi:hypothetical protein ACFP1Z_32240 [Streptomyces gamaensis]|uniref:Transferase n=1 Tax=Streptomyces gamaensis TaxID=1763542 RepID=A0ABW0ZA15_9ACTN